MFSVVTQVAIVEVLVVRQSAGSRSCSVMSATSFTTGASVLSSATADRTPDSHSGTRSSTGRGRHPPGQAAGAGEDGDGFEPVELADRPGPELLALGVVPTDLLDRGQYVVGRAAVLQEGDHLEALACAEHVERGKPHGHVRVADGDDRPVGVHIPERADRHGRLDVVRVAVVDLVPQVLAQTFEVLQGERDGGVVVRERERVGDAVGKRRRARGGPWFRRLLVLPSW